MSEILDNAIKSIRLGIEDFRTADDDRMLSAARNYYAGLLLLAKECLIRAAPEVDPMEIIGAKFKPVPDGEGGVKHVVEGYATIDLAQLQTRFKDFGLAWPDTDIKKLQRYRNDLEHFHLKEPASALGEAIGSSFTMVVDLFGTLGEDPQSVLEDLWETILEQKEAFEKVQKACLASWEPIQWPEDVEHMDRLSCSQCGSSLIGQVDPANSEHTQVQSKCFQCGEEFDFEKTMEMVVEASFGVDAYIMAKEGMSSAIADCPECGSSTYVEAGEISVCYTCGESVSGECIRCGTGINVHEYNSDYPDLCSYCAYMTEKVMQE